MSKYGVFDETHKRCLKAGMPVTIIEEQQAGILAMDSDGNERTLPYGKFALYKWQEDGKYEFAPLGFTKADALKKSKDEYIREAEKIDDTYFPGHMRNWWIYSKKCADRWHSRNRRIRQFFALRRISESQAMQT